MASIILAVLTFWFGLAGNEAAGFVIRVAALGTVVSLQGYMLQRFLAFHIRRRREAAALAAHAAAEAQKAKQAEKSKAKKAAKKNSEEEINDLPEVDQNTKKNLRPRPAAAKAK